MQNTEQAIERRLADPAFSQGLIRRSFLINTILAVGVLGLVGDRIYQSTHPPQPRYFYTDGKGRPYEIRPLDAPVMSDVDLLVWTTRAVVTAYSVDFARYQEQFQAAAAYFTDPGWAGFSQTFIATGNFEKLRKARLVASAVPKMAPTITNRQVIGSTLNYQVELPLVVTDPNNNQANAQDLLVKVMVVRTIETDHPDGVAIAEINAAPI